MPRERHLIVPMQHSASSGLGRGFEPRFVTGSLNIIILYRIKNNFYDNILS